MKEEITVGAKCKIMIDGNSANATVKEVWPTTYTVEIDGTGAIHSNISKDIWFPVKVSDVSD